MGPVTGFVSRRQFQQAQFFSGSQRPLLGLVAVAAACMLSGLAGVWLERIVKRTSEIPIWLRNIQLGASAGTF